MDQPADAPRARGSHGPFLALLCLTAFVSSWTGISYQGVNLVDLALLAVVAAVVVTAASGFAVPVPAWFAVPSLGSLAVLAIEAFVRDGAGWDKGLEFTFRTVLSTLVVAVALATYAANVSEPRKLLWVARFWLLGVGVSAAGAVAFDAGLVNLAFVNSVSAEVGDRTSGFTSHPNALAFSLVISLPACAYLACASRRPLVSASWAGLAILSAFALFDADSRIGLAVGFSAALAAVVLAVGGRRGRYAAIPLVLGLVMLAVLTFIPDLISATRLAGSRGELSNVGRSRLNGEAFENFGQNPLVGAGYLEQGGVSAQLQLLSAGGLLLFLAHYLFFAVLVWKLASIRTAFARVAVVILGATFAFGFFQPTVTERATYWIPLCVLFAATEIVRPKHSKALSLSGT